MLIRISCACRFVSFRFHGIETSFFFSFIVDRRSFLLVSLLYSASFFLDRASVSRPVFFFSSSKESQEMNNGTDDNTDGEDSPPPQEEEEDKKTYNHPNIDEPPEPNENSPRREDTEIHPNLDDENDDDKEEEEEDDSDDDDDDHTTHHHWSDKDIHYVVQRMCSTVAHLRSEKPIKCCYTLSREKDLKRFVEGIIEYGHGSWGKIAKHVRTRDRYKVKNTWKVLQAEGLVCRIKVGPRIIPCALRKKGSIYKRFE